MILLKWQNRVLKMKLFHQVAELNMPISITLKYGKLVYQMQFDLITIRIFPNPDSNTMAFTLIPNHYDILSHYI